MQPVSTLGYSQATPSASAVNIQVFEPKAYAAPQQAGQCPTYAYPQQSVYTQPYVNQYQQFMPQQVAPMPMYQPQALPMAQTLPEAQTAPVPQQEMPAPVLEQAPQAPSAPAAPTNPQALTDTQVPQAPAATEAPSVAQTPTDVQNTSNVDVNALVEGLKSTDNKVQEDAITKIANYSEGDPEMKNAVLTEPVMKGLVDIVKQDTSGLQGPSEAQVAALNKAASGAELTPEEQALTQELAPKTKADKNRVISMFTLALLQKNQRDEIDRYNQTQAPEAQLPQLKINDLMGYNEIENVIRNDAEKEVKLAGIQALAYVARPEDKATVEPVLNAALQDPEPLIQQAANEALAAINGAPQGDAAQGQAPQGDAAAQPDGSNTAEVDVSKMSKKEKRAYEKEQKRLAKEAAKAAKAAK